MPDALNNPIHTLPSTHASGAAADVLVRVLPMSERLADLWHLQIQPLVDKNYVNASGAQAGQKTRADVGWNWRSQLRLAGLHSVASRANRHGPAIAMAMVISTGLTGLFPIGMLIAVPQLHCNALGMRRHRGFAWYLADAPSEAYSQLLKRPYVKGVAKALLDCGIQAALDRGQDGTFLLHADPNGGVRLQDFYRNKCGMDQLPSGAPAVTHIFRRWHSEEYFHFDDVQAMAFCAQFDSRR